MEHLQGIQVPIAGDGGTRLSRTARLRKHSDFEKVYSHGRRLFSAHMTFFFLGRSPVSAADENESAGNDHPARVGFTVPRALGAAVERNRIRRRMREAVRLERGEPRRVDIVIHPKKSVLTADFSELRQEVARAFEKISSQLATRERAPGREAR